MSTSPDMTNPPPRRPAQVVFGLAALALSGCSAGAPSFVLFGAFFPVWLLCGTLGVVAAGVARAVFVASGLSDVLPYQLFVCTAVGVIVALFCWLIGFGQ
jgi:hypothetical protein